MSGIFIGEVWRHVKTETDYLITGFCRLEATGAEGVLYIAVRGRDTTVWARDRGEFMDGRFSLSP